MSEPERPYDSCKLWVTARLARMDFKLTLILGVAVGLGFKELVSIFL